MSSLSERFESATSIAESSPEKAVPQFESMQEEVARLGLFSTNESLDDISTKSLRLLALEHFLALALTCLPATPEKMSNRRRHLLKAMDLWASFLQRLEELELLKAQDLKEFHNLLDLSGSSNTDNDKPPQLPPAALSRREDKIARFRAKQEIQQELKRLQALNERRKRLGMGSEDIVDAYDEESLERTIALKSLEIYKVESIENWGQVHQELPMIEMMIKSQEQRNQMQKHRGGGIESADQDDRRKKSQQQSGGMQVTHITQDAATGQLQFRRDEIRSQVFRPGWNQPTMSLEQLGEIERERAIEREERQKIAEAQQKQKPQKYEQLVRDGLEDNAELVDASAKLDQDWDDWKDDNPRGSGNKRGDVGDRNF